MKLTVTVIAIIVSISISYIYAENPVHSTPITYKQLIDLEQNSKLGITSIGIHNKINSISDFIDIPLNDSCENAIPITAPYPAYGIGSTIDATLDCPSLLYWQGIWYTIELPYNYNDITITICGLSEDLLDAGIIIMDDCNCDDLIGASTVTFLEQSQCSTGYTGLTLEFSSIPSGINPESLAFWPVFTSNNDGLPIEFSYWIDISEGNPPPVGDICEDPIIISGLPYIDSLNSCDFNNDYNFSGNDVIYQFSIDGCRIVDISICGTTPIYDSYMLLFDNENCGSVPLATDDDACMPPGEYGTSKIIDTLEAGTYFVSIDAYSGECGEYILEINTTPCPVYGACCVETECIGTTLEQSCDSLSGNWIANEDCSQGYLCPGSCCEYLVGDISMAYGNWPPLVLGSDVTYLVNYFRGLEINTNCLINGFWCSADVNGDCRVIGSDVSLLVNYFRGMASLTGCPTYTPCWPTSNELPSVAPSGWPNCSD